VNWYCNWLSFYLRRNGIESLSDIDPFYFFSKVFLVKLLSSMNQRQFFHPFIESISYCLFSGNWKFSGNFNPRDINYQSNKTIYSKNNFHISTKVTSSMITDSTEENKRNLHSLSVSRDDIRALSMLCSMSAHRDTS
jgi:hypothetical protein